jgi:adenylate cyclase
VTHVFKRLELSTVDARFGVRGQQQRPRQIAVVGIDSATIHDLNAWPFRRRYHAQLIDRLRADGARVIVYDVQFTEASPYPQDDQRLFDSVQRAGNVVLGTAEVGRHGATSIFGGDANVRAARAVAAWTNFPLDSDGVIRRVQYAPDGLRSLSVAAVARSGQPVPRREFPRDGAWIDFPGGQGTIPTYSFISVLRGRVPRSAFAGKIVVVGATAPVLQDVHAVSTTPRMAGPEIQADAIATIERGIPLRSVGGEIAVALIVALGLLPAMLGLRLSGMGVVAASVPIFGVFLVAAQLAFDAGRVLPVSDPGFALLLGMIGALTVHYFTEVRERHRVRRAFARFVPAEVVDQVLAQAGDDLRLGGREVQASVLFSDVRGFTTFSERTPAAQVIEVLNRYLTEMTGAIMAHGGVVVSYMGDGIMAVFGAPIESADHADRALDAAREMLEVRLPRFNDWARAQGLPEFEIGIGINSGSVMAGNVGSEQRLEFTAIGDTTNTASRLESMTKGTPFVALVADETVAQLHSRDGLTLVGEQPVRGRATGVRVWGIARPGAALPVRTSGPRAAALPDELSITAETEVPEASDGALKVVIPDQPDLDEADATHA